MPRTPAEKTAVTPRRGPSWMDLGVGLAVVAALAFTLGVLVGKGGKPQTPEYTQTTPANPLAPTLAPNPAPAPTPVVKTDLADAASEAQASPPAPPKPRSSMSPPGENLSGADAATTNAQPETADEGPANAPERIWVIGERLASVSSFAPTELNPLETPPASGETAALRDGTGEIPVFTEWRTGIDALREVSKALVAWDAKLGRGATFVALQAISPSPTDQDQALGLVLQLTDQVSGSATQLTRSLADLEAAAREVDSTWRIVEIEGSQEYLHASDLGAHVYRSQTMARRLLADAKVAERRLSQTRIAVDELSQSLRSVSDDALSDSAAVLAERVVDPLKFKLDAALQLLTRAHARMLTEEQAIERVLELFPNQSERFDDVNNPLTETYPDGALTPPAATKAIKNPLARAMETDNAQ